MSYTDEEREETRAAHEQAVQAAKEYRAARLAALESGQAQAPTESPEHKQQPRAKHRRYH
jgi:hypothetical protein